MLLFCSYTVRFDKVELDKVVENVCDLPDPEVVSVHMQFFSGFSY